MKQWIDGASYEDLLRRWRWCRPGAQIFQGLTGQHFQAVMVARRQAEGEAAAVRASKAVGWTPRG